MRYLTMIVLVGSFLSVAGCGAVDDVKKEAGDRVRREVAEQCRTQAKKIKDPETRKTTLEACDAARTGDADQLRSKLAEACLSSARDIGGSTEREQAERQCREIRSTK